MIDSFTIGEKRETMEIKGILTETNRYKWGTRNTTRIKPWIQFKPISYNLSKQI